MFHLVQSNKQSFPAFPALWSPSEVDRFANFTYSAVAMDVNRKVEKAVCSRWPTKTCCKNWLLIAFLQLMFPLEKGKRFRSVLVNKCTCTRFWFWTIHVLRDFTSGCATLSDARNKIKKKKPHKFHCYVFMLHVPTREHMTHDRLDLEKTEMSFSICCVSETGSSWSFGFPRTVSNLRMI